ncbi:hypothetical protein N302_03675, partial [Corvus brachyrhynchos]
AAIDFLLLADGHGCEEFEGLCCMDLSTEGNSIQAKIHEIQQQVQNLQV